MTAQRYRRGALALRSVLREEPICFTCRLALSLRRNASSSAAAPSVVVPDHDTSTPQQTLPPVTQAQRDRAPQHIYRLLTSVVLSRPPVITKDLHPFESAYYLYQKRLNERLAMPWTRYFYHKAGSPTDIEWKRKAKARLTPARDIGRYSGFGPEAWNDEVLVGSKVRENAHTVEALIRDAETPEVPTTIDGQEIPMTPKEELSKKQSLTSLVLLRKEQLIERPAPRTTEADRTGDLHSLDRALQRTLYLLVKDEKGRWLFPTDRMAGQESLHIGAERILVQTGGIDMNTWVVGNAPVGHYSRKYLEPVADDRHEDVKQIGEKAFFMKARIMAGQPDLSQNQFGYTDYRWVTKEEVQRDVSTFYWSQVKHMLVER